MKTICPRSHNEQYFEGILEVIPNEIMDRVVNLLPIKELYP